MRRFRRGGFFIIFGYRGQNAPDGRQMFQGICPVCRNQSWFQGFKSRRWLTLFFIPVLPLGPATRYTRCAGCGSQFRQSLQQMQRQLRTQGPIGGPSLGASMGMPKRDSFGHATPQAVPPAARSAADAAPGAPLTPAGALYNELRDTPKDSAKLAALLRLHLEMGSPRQALATAKAFPEACDASDTCLLLCAQACTRLGESDRAYLNASAALALNPANAEAARMVKSQTPGGATDAMARWAQSLERPA